jgi:hypothetical protein
MASRYVTLRDEVQPRRKTPASFFAVGFIMRNETIHLIHENKTFEDQTIYLSGNIYLDCTFKRCVLIIRDEFVPQMSNVKIEACIFHLDLLIHDHEQWTGFLNGLGKKIEQGLPRALGDKS